MTDYISREAAIVPSFRYLLPNGEKSPPVVFVKTLLHSIPAADVRPVVRGKWLLADDGDGKVCSICGTDYCDLVLPVWEWNFCPNCGSDMREEN